MGTDSQDYLSFSNVVLLFPLSSLIFSFRVYSMYLYLSVVVCLFNVEKGI